LNASSQGPWRRGAGGGPRRRLPGPADSCRGCGGHACPEYAILALRREMNAENPHHGALTYHAVADPQSSIMFVDPRGFTDLFGEVPRLLWRDAQGIEGYSIRPRLRSRSAVHGLRHQYRRRDGCLASIRGSSWAAVATMHEDSLVGQTACTSRSREFRATCSSTGDRGPRRKSLAPLVDPAQLGGNCPGQAPARGTPRR